MTRKDYYKHQQMLISFSPWSCLCGPLILSGPSVANFTLRVMLTLQTAFSDPLLSDLFLTPRNMSHEVQQEIQTKLINDPCLTFVLSSMLLDTQPHLTFSSLTFSHETIKAISRPPLLLPLLWFSVHQKGVDFQSLVYLLISSIYLSLSHPLCRSSLSLTLIPYQPTSHPSPCCLSHQIHHLPICLMLPMLWDDLLRESNWRPTEGGRDRRGSYRKIQKDYILSHGRHSLHFTTWLLTVVFLSP